MTEHTSLNPRRFDAILASPEKLWGLNSIAAAIGLSVDATRRLAHSGKAPIYRPDGRRYFALRSELNAWLRSKPAQRRA